MRLFEASLLLYLAVCTLAVSFTKDLPASIIILASCSLSMAIVWVLLQSPDLATTKTAVGAGVTSVLFFATLKRIRAIQKEDNDE